MNKDLFAKLCFNFNKEPNQELYELWDEELKDYDPLYVDKAIKNIMVKDKFIPTLSRIIEEIKSLPTIKISEEEKVKRMKQQDIVPSWINEKEV